MKESISVTVSLEELRQLLFKQLTGPYAELLSKVIIGNLDASNRGLDQLFKALNGITNEIKWKSGMDILLKKDVIYNSDIDWSAMEEKGFVHQGYVKGTIVNINIYGYSPITARIYIITKKGTSTDYDVNTDVSYIIAGEEWPEFTPVDTNLPF